MSRLGTDGDKDSEIIPNTNINFKQKHKIDGVFNSSHRVTGLQCHQHHNIVSNYWVFVWRKRNDKV